MLPCCLSLRYCPVSDTWNIPFCSVCSSSLCACLSAGEKGYDPKFFHYRVERVFIDDHNVPSLE